MTKQYMPQPVAVCNANRRKNRIAIADLIDRESSRQSAQPSGPVRRLAPGTYAIFREEKRLRYALGAWGTRERRNRSGVSAPLPRRRQRQAVRDDPPGRRHHPRLAKLLGMLGNSHDGEVVNAGRATDALVRKAGCTWCDNIAPTSVDQPRQWSSFRDDETIAFCLGRYEVLTAWEVDFLRDIQSRASRFGLTEKQRAVLDRLASKCGRR